jgi:hypothetical protein
MFPETSVLPGAALQKVPEDIIFTAVKISQRKTFVCPT